MGHIGPASRVTRILVVEDDKEIAAEIAEYLGRRGHEVTVCNDLRAARNVLTVAIASGRPPRVVLCDVDLIEGDAGDLYLAFAARLDCRWILMSGYIDLGDVEEKIARAAGPQPVFVSKPMSLSILRWLIEGDLAPCTRS